jgi:hypothetical protein
LSDVLDHGVNVFPKLLDIVEREHVGLHYAPIGRLPLDPRDGEARVAIAIDRELDARLHAHLRPMERRDVYKLLATGWQHSASSRGWRRSFSVTSSRANNTDCSAWLGGFSEWEIGLRRCGSAPRRDTM